MNGGPIVLPLGTRIGKRWTVTSQLGEGAFGGAYACTDGTIRAALKIEPQDANPPLINMEAMILTELNSKVAEDGHRQFPALLEAGRDAQFDATTGQLSFYKYIAVSLLGQPLDQLVADAGGQLSAGTAISVAIQLLSAVRTLHGIGYLHRDIKPANVCIGRQELGEQRRIYLLDFGLGRKYMEADGSLCRFREKAWFRGSLRYSAISMHLNREHGRNVDVESWFYVLVELYTGRLPWNHLGDMDEIGERKSLRDYTKPEHVRQQAVAELLEGCPDLFGLILGHIDGLTTSSCPNYSWMIQILTEHLAVNNMLDTPYEWELNAGPEAAGDNPP